MTAHTPHIKYPGAPWRPFELVVERILGADMRLLWGMAVPVIGCCVAIALALGFAASPGVVAGLMVLEAVLLAIVVVGFVGVLNDDDDDGSHLG